jgi:HK97 family phage portal protein
VAFLSNGVLVKSPTQYFTPASWNGIPQPGITLRWGAYSSIYQRQLWVAVLVNKIANATARLPLKVYERSDLDRPEARDHPYAQLLRNPNDQIDPFLFWLWVSSTLNIYGEAFLVKQRDGLGRPVKLLPWHPTGVRDDVVEGRRRWALHRSDGEWQVIDRRDLIHFRTYNPDSLVRGMSPLEPLRDTLENDAGARAASSAMWRNGGRPSLILRHPMTFKKNETVQRIRDQFSEAHGGVSNWAKPAILEEGMEAQILQLSSEELQYIESRKLNREECCAAYDVPPPVVHILDRATFSNITEQMRSMYRDTMAPKLRLIESTLETELRDGRMGRSDIPPDFGDDVYAEFLMDEVLRGDFENRSIAYRNADFMTVAEKRSKENLPYIPGTDQIFINSASLPLQPDGTLEQPRPVLALTAGTVRNLMGRLSRQQTVDDIDMRALVAGLSGSETDTVKSALASAHSNALSIAQFRDVIRSMETTHE